MSALAKPSARTNLRRNEARAYLMETYGVSYTENTLARLATQGGGPAFVKIGRFPLYPIEELDRWIADKTSGLKRSTSE